MREQRENLNEPSNSRFNSDRFSKGARARTFHRGEKKSAHNVSRKLPLYRRAPNPPPSWSITRTPTPRSSRVNLYDAFLRHFGRSIVSIHLREKGRRALHVCYESVVHLRARRRPSCVRPRRRMRQLGRRYVGSALKMSPRRSGSAIVPI